MKFQILIELTFMLIAKHKVTVREIMNRFEISRRTVFRYIDAITLANVPVTVSYGRNGGYYIPKDYKLKSTFFTQEELKLLIALLDAASETHDNNQLVFNINDLASAKLKLKEKLSSFVNG